MTRTYRGKNRFVLIKPEHEDEVLILVETTPEHINFIIKMVETYCHTALPIQLDPEKGLIGFHTTKDKSAELINILKNIPRPLQIVQ